MNKIFLFSVSIFCLGLSACHKIPSECEKSWKQMESIAHQSGIPDEAIKNQKKEFEQQINAMPKDQAIESCNAQSSILSKITN